MYMCTHTHSHCPSPGRSTPVVVTECVDGIWIGVHLSFGELRLSEALVTLSHCINSEQCLHTSASSLQEFCTHSGMHSLGSYP